LDWIVKSRIARDADAVHGTSHPRYVPSATRRGGLTEKGRRTRRRIIETAARLMLEQGVAETTVEQVRDEAEVSSSQIYHYFADKQDLVLAVIDHEAETIVGLQKPLFDGLDTMAGLRRWRDAMVGVQVDRGCRGGCPLGSLGVELAETDERARQRVAAGFARWEEALRGGLRSMRAAGRLTACADPDALAVALLTALQGGLMLAQLTRETRSLEIALDAVLELIESKAA
jgi:TetR/AcrR family transcriptional repressor of nem operon